MQPAIGVDLVQWCVMSEKVTVTDDPFEQFNRTQPPAKRIFTTVDDILGETPDREIVTRPLPIASSAQEGAISVVPDSVQVNMWRSGPTNVAELRRGVIALSVAITADPPVGLFNVSALATLYDSADEPPRIDTKYAGSITSHQDKMGLLNLVADCLEQVD